MLRVLWETNQFMTKLSLWTAAIFFIFSGFDLGAGLIGMLVWPMIFSVLIAFFFGAVKSFLKNI